MRWVLLAAAALFVGLLGGVAFIFLVHEPEEAKAERELTPLPVQGTASVSNYEPAKREVANSIMVAKLTPEETGVAAASDGRPQAAAKPAAASGASEPSAETLMERSAQKFKDAIRASEKGFRDLAESYTKRFPSVRQYGKDWMSHPDLRKLNDDYMRDHDPIAFLRGLSASPTFPLLLRKYAGDPALRNFVGESLAKAPVGAVSDSMGYISQDKQIDGFVKDVATKMGVPASTLSLPPGAAQYYQQQAGPNITAPPR
jgi:hypothetical protein